jgi:carbon storage regulator
VLVLSRKVGQELVIGDNIRIVISRMVGNRVTIGIEAPDDVSILRGELQAIHNEFEDESRDVLKLPRAGRQPKETPVVAARCAQ